MTLTIAIGIFLLGAVAHHGLCLVIGFLDEPLREPFPPVPNENCGND